MPFPYERPRRLRRTPTLRRLVRETTLTVDDLVQPLFVVEGKNSRQPILSLTGQYHLSIDAAVAECLELYEIGIPAVILFGIPNSKDSHASEAWKEDGLIQRAVRAIKSVVPDLIVITDVCLCEYTDHGHCGVLKGETVDNDTTLGLLARTALSHAHSGADVVAPSDMMDGRVGAIRKAFNEHFFPDTLILSYAVKYASGFYGPFREAAQSAPSFGDRRGYQMDPSNFEEALHEAALDLEEGADMIMVKPALPCLDVLHEIKRRFQRVTAAYQVSGEYAMVEAAAAAGLLDRKRVICESLICIKRAGADFILTYWAKEAADWIKNGEFAW